MLKTMEKISTMFASILISVGMVSCSSEGDLKTSVGKGRVAFEINTSAEFSSRSLKESDWKVVANYSVEIIDKDDKVIETYSSASIPETLELEQGVYTIRAFYGAEHAASRSEFLSEDIKPLVLNIGDEKKVSLRCTPTCGKVTINFGESMSTYFDDYFVTFSTPKMEAGAEATWAKNDTEPWYFAVSDKGDQVVATIHLTPNKNYMADTSKEGTDWSEGTVTRTYTLLRNKAWSLSIDPSYTSSEGTLGVNITIDDSTVDHDVDVAIPAEWI